MFTLWVLRLQRSAFSRFATPPKSWLPSRIRHLRPTGYQPACLQLDDREQLGALGWNRTSMTLLKRQGSSRLSYECETFFIP
jgi:hypothetical protein